MLRRRHPAKSVKWLIKHYWSAAVKNVFAVMAKTAKTGKRLYRVLRVSAIGIRRMEITGARWSLEGAEAVLKLGTLRSGQDFDQYWDFHEAREHKRNHLALYDDGVVPSTIKPHLTRKQRQLKRIK